MIQDEGTKEVVGGASRAFVARAAGAALSFGVGVAVGRALGPDGAGTYFLAVTFATIGSTFGRLGLDQMLCKRTAACLAHQDFAGVQGTWRRGVALSATASAAVSALLFLAAPAIADALGKANVAPAIQRVALAVVPVSLFMLFSELLRGLKRSGASQLVQFAAPPGLTLCFFGALGPLLGWTPETGVTAYFCGAACAAAFGAFVWKSATPWLAGVKGKARTREIARSALPFLGVATLGMFFPWVSVLTLGYFGTEDDVGLFSVAYRTAALTSFVLTAVNAIAGPRFAALYARGERAELLRSARQATLLITVCALPILVVLWVIPGTVMSLFGPRFVEGSRCLTILATGQFVNVVTGSVGQLLLMSGHERPMRAGLAGGAVATLVLHLVLVPRYGVEGAALASAIALAGTNVALLLLVRRYL